MKKCPTCSTEIGAGAAGCPKCGDASFDRTPAMTETGLTEDLPPAGKFSRSQPPSGSSASGLLSSSDGVDDGYAAGTILAGRYRVVGLLGRGGMGQVYRADDLTLGQAVALKFLPDELSEDESRLERFRSEVRVSRHVSHPNVCRVHDIGEADGKVFLSMELVDGGDLSSLLKRVGRLPADKGLEIARQLCAGLAAAHDRGVLHRDLKPANVMIDAEGKVRIADFGLAGLAGGFEAGEIRSGTPAYMAPETLSGQEVTQKSDIYALGLVLYELFTGRQAFDAGSVNEYLSKHRHETPAMPSEIVSDVDPEVEGVVLKCLAKNPEERPASALVVSMMLPGGDPLAAMLAAGETPSPELIAQAGDEGTLAPGKAWLLFAATVVLLVVAAVLEKPRHLLDLVPMERPPAVQLDRAREGLTELGLEVPTGDIKVGFATDRGLVREMEREGVSADERAAMAAGEIAPLRFWMRAAPEALVNPRASGVVTPNRPARRQPGEIYASFDSAGNLRELEAVPLELLPTASPGTGDQLGEDWSRLFAAMGLDPAGFAPADAMWAPPQHVDRLVAWATVDESSALQVSRIEAGTLGGRIAYVRSVLAFEDEAEAASTSARDSTVAQTLNVALIMAVLGGGGLLTRRNIRLGRVDSRGARRVAGVIVGLQMAAWLFRADHAAAAGSEFGLFVLAVGDALFVGGFVWLLYMALEPEVRRHWPARLISWERLLTRRVHDPLVGRHVLIGLALGSGLTMMLWLTGYVIWLRFEPWSEIAESGTALISRGPLVIAAVFDQLGQAVFSGLFITVLVVLARLFLRRTWAAVVLASAVFIGLNTLQGDPWYIDAAVATILLAVVMYALLRYGLLTLVVTLLVLNLFQAVPLILSPGSWYAIATILPLLAVSALAFAAFAAAVGKQPWIPMD